MGEQLRPGFVEGEEERIAYLFEAWRCHQALNQAPAIIGHVRSLVVDSDGRTEPGETLRYQTAPIRVSPADASDEFYAQLVGWVVYWAERLALNVPPATAVAWRSGRDGEAYGFRAGTTVDGAALLTRLQTMWLLQHHGQIIVHDEGPGYVRFVTESIWDLRSKFPMQDRGARDRPVDSRPCPICRGDTVDVHWYSEHDRDKPAVLCSLCGWMPANERETLRVMERVVA